jgi:hypothetical protein
MDRELNRGLIRPPQVTYKELWMLGQKVSNGKMRWNGIAMSGVFICEWNFWSMAPEVCDVDRKERRVTAGVAAHGW